MWDNENFMPDWDRDKNANVCKKNYGSFPSEAAS